MPPRPLYRWKSFWLGVIVLLFLGWSWRDSRDFGSQAGYGSLTRHLSFSSRASTVSILLRRDGLYQGLSIHRFPLRNLRPIPWFQSLGSYTERQPRNDYTAWYFPHWFLILLFLISWSAFLVWRWRRMKRGITTST